MAKKLSMWLDLHPILDEKDTHQLERDAAIHEFGESKLPRDQAEAKAYKAYRDDHHAQAAAYHLARMKAGSGEDAAKHALHYQLHVKALGFDPSGEIPVQVKNAMEADKKSPVEWKSHKADNLLFHNELGKDEVPNRLQTLRKAIFVAQELSKALTSLGFTPAFLDTRTGQITQSPGSHNLGVLPEDAITPEGELAPHFRTGFVDKSGNWMDRAAASKRAGLPEHELQSEELK